ncbi:hypothetical protein C6V04_08480 [Burkholderia multivorans]|uniref:hypothetical protein n=1 Tax=Burkholderia multivorans TaxID=87883 RepID=UPI000CFFC3AA|nr:hypothetical protein [Burkholderia multivorans]PRG95383.1 hypothetical protein C6V04_08480 [Burkholderia multivorans]
MGQVTEETCRFIIEYADRDERFPLTVNEMRQLAYLANQQIRAARRTAPDRDAIIEECAKVCDEYAADQWSLYKGRAPYTGSEPSRADSGVQGRSDGADVCASRIRELKTAPTAASSSEATDDKNVYVSVRFKDTVVRRSITTAELDSFASQEVPARLFGSDVQAAIKVARGSSRGRY